MLRLPRWLGAGILARSRRQLRLHLQRSFTVLIGHLQIKLLHRLDAVTRPFADDVHRMMQHQISRPGRSKILECFRPWLQVAAFDDPMRLVPQVRFNTPATVNHKHAAFTEHLAAAAKGSVCHLLVGRPHYNPSDRNRILTVAAKHQTAHLSRDRLACAITSKESIR